MRTTIASGTRLVPRTIAEPVPGGVDVPVGVWDSQLGAFCTPLRYSDGTIRCIPEHDADAGPYFADAYKTIPVVVLPLSDGQARQGTLSGRNTASPDSPFNCPKTSLQQFGRIGSLRAETSYWNQNTMSTPVPAGYGLFNLELLPDDFVELHEVRAQLDGTIAIRELHGTDGSRLPATELFDEAHDVPVKIIYQDSAWRLLPPFAKRAATTAHRAPPPGGVSVYWCDHGDLLFAARNEAGCDVSSYGFVTDGAYAPYTTYSVAKQTGKIYGCQWKEGTPTLTTMGGTFLEPCAVVPATEWTSAQQIDLGSGRITTAAYSIGSATFAPYSRTFERYFFDTSLAVTCLPRTATDGTLRCLPVGGVVAYSDADCTSPVVAVSYSSPVPVFAVKGSVPSYWFPSALGTLTVYGVGAERPAGTLYAPTPDVPCHAFDGFRSFEVTGVVPPSSFAALELRDAP